MAGCTLCGVPHVGVCPVREALARAVPIGQLSREERALQALGFAYGNLAMSSRHQPQKEAFKKIALERGLSEAAFNEWADKRRWWIGRMLSEEPARTGEQIAELRAKSIAADVGDGRSLMGSGLSGASAGAPDKFTCDECGAVRTCAFAFDWYNTGGDCLAEK